MAANSADGKRHSNALSCDLPLFQVIVAEVDPASVVGMRIKARAL
jgi:hypothetical protein